MDVESRPEPAFDPVEEASEESFPASDPPARTVVTGVGEPVRSRGRDEVDQPRPAVADVKSPEPYPFDSETRS